MIIWAGTSNLDVGMIVEHYPSIITPRKSLEVQNIPGRNGSIVTESGSFENYEQSYQVFLDAKYIGGLEQVMPKLVNWLLGHEGYQRLEDSYFPDVYRLAYYAGGSEFISIFNEYGEGTLVFNCAPEKYLKHGERDISLIKNQVLLNPTVFPALPLIKITGNNSSGTISFNGNSLAISSVPSNLILDVKLHKAYYEATNYNSRITGSYEDFTLSRETTITWTGGITSVTIVPRWWTV